MDDLRLGLIETARFLVTKEMLVPAFSKELFPTWQRMPPVLATIMMIGLIEEACVKLAHPRLHLGQITVGSSVNVRHIAATPIGLEVVATVVLTEIDGARLVFEATCRDSIQEIGKGIHERWIVDRSRFESATAAKAKGRREPPHRGP
jgi:fluoroacetyl-CoA thioesterase